MANHNTVSYNINWYSKRQGLRTGMPCFGSFDYANNDFIVIYISTDHAKRLNEELRQEWLAWIADWMKIPFNILDKEALAGYAAWDDSHHGYRVNKADCLNNKTLMYVMLTLLRGEVEHPQFVELMLYIRKYLNNNNLFQVYHIATYISNKAQRSWTNVIFKEKRTIASPPAGGHSLVSIDRIWDFTKPVRKDMHPDVFAYVDSLRTIHLGSCTGLRINVSLSNNVHTHSINVPMKEYVEGVNSLNKFLDECVHPSWRNVE